VKPDEFQADLPALRVRDERTREFGDEVESVDDKSVRAEEGKRDGLQAKFSLLAL
jgi:uncharacterized protein YdcH (DUF465 family)